MLTSTINIKSWAACSEAKASGGQEHLPAPKPGDEGSGNKTKGLQETNECKF